MKTALVVDDSAVIRKVAGRIFEMFRFSVSEADDGRTALEACSVSMPDLILLDWSLPNMNSIEFLRELRKMPNGAKPKVVYCATENDQLQIGRAMRAGADDFVMKPFDKEILQVKLEDIGLL